MNKIILKSTISIGLAFALMAIGNSAVADTVTGNLSTGISGTNGNGMTGVVVSPPVPNPAAGMYPSAQSVTLTASGATNIYYTTDGSTPDCSVPTGTLYSGAIAVNSSEPIEAVSCYSESSGIASSTVAVYLYGIDPTTPSGGSSYVASSGGGGGGGSFSSGGGSSGGSTTVGIADFVLLMANWGQPGAGNPADWSGDATIGVQDFVWLMANWTV